MKAKREKLLLICVLVLGLVVRLAAMFFAPQAPSSADEGLYYRTAIDLIEKGFLHFLLTFSERSPLYPVFLAFCIKLFGNPVSALWIQALLSVFWPLILWDIAKKVGLKERFALAVALVASVFPPFILYPTRSWLAESTFTTLILLSSWLSLASSGFWSGLTWGISALFRPTGSILALGYPLSNITRLKALVVFLVGFVPLPATFFALNYFRAKNQCRMAHMLVRVS